MVEADMRSGKKPTFFVIGAPKCGTSSLCHYLSRHPNVFFSVPKEPMFWCMEDELLRRQTRVTTMGAYLRLFAGAREQHLAVGEGSTCYLSSKWAVARIHDFNPDARFIIMLRDPVEMLHAWHGELIFNLDEDIEDFEKAWRVQSARGRGDGIPRGCRSASFLQYAEMARYSVQVERCLSIVDSARLLVILFDDFAAKTRRVYQEVLQFLQLPDDGRLDFPRLREGQMHRSRIIARIVLKPPEVIATPIAWIRRAAERNENSIAGIMSHWSRIKQRRQPLRPEFENELRQYFRPDIERLALLIGRDLSHWTTKSRYSLESIASLTAIRDQSAIDETGSI